MDYNNEVNEKIISNNEEDKIQQEESNVFYDPNHSKTSDRFNESYNKQTMCKFEIESLTEDHN